MNSANRTIRPYKDIAAVEGVLDGAVLRFGPDECTAGTRLHVDLLPHEFLVRSVVIDLVPGETDPVRFREHLTSALVKAGLEDALVDLVVIAKSSFLRIAEVVYRERLSRVYEFPRSLDLSGSPERPRALRAPFSGFELDIALILACDLPPKPLRPFRKGTWLARTQLGVDTSLSRVLFSPVPLTPELRESLNIRPKASRFVDFDDYDFTDPSLNQELPKFYVDAELLAQLHARRSSTTARAIQVQLAVDFMAAMIQKAGKLADQGLTYDDISSSVLGSLVRMLSDPAGTASGRDSILAKIIHQPSRALADVEHVMSVASTYIAALTSEEN